MKHGPGCSTATTTATNSFWIATAIRTVNPDPDEDLAMSNGIRSQVQREPAYLEAGAQDLAALVTEAADYYLLAQLLLDCRQANEVLTARGAHSRLWRAQGRPRRPQDGGWVGCGAAALPVSPWRDWRPSANVSRDFAFARPSADRRLHGRRD
jgi:hypothetical protein